MKCKHFWNWNWERAIEKERERKTRELDKNIENFWNEKQKKKSALQRFLFGLFTTNYQEKQLQCIWIEFLKQTKWQIDDAVIWIRVEALQKVY